MEIKSLWLTENLDLQSQSSLAANQHIHGNRLYAQWKHQSNEARHAQSDAWSSISAGDRGYLREAYHGELYATRYLCAEAFATGAARISSAVLRDRLPRAVALAEERERKLYGGNKASVETVKKSYRDFVQLCHDKELETGEPVQIIASF